MATVRALGGQCQALS